MNGSGQEIGSRIASRPPSLSGARREVLVAGHSAPPSASATRARHLRKIAGTRAYVFTLVLAGGGLFLLGASTGKIVWAVILPLIVVVAVVVAAWRRATRLAERDFFAGYALEHQFDYSQRMTLLGTTPLLDAGDRRHCEHYMEGELDGMPGVGVGLSHFVYETRQTRTDRRNRPISVYTPHQYTIAVVDLPRALTAFPGVHLARRGGWLGGDEWLGRDALVPVELESSELAKDYELLVRSDQDRGRLLELFKPSFQVWLTELPFQMFFEYAGGTLVVYVPRRLKSTRDLNDMLFAAGWIAKLIVREGEPLKMVAALRSKAPPRGVGAFPPPPPATKPQVEPTLHVEPALHVAPAPPPTPDYTRASIPPPSAG